MSVKNAVDIQKKYEEEDRRRRMAKKMAEEEQRRRDINVEYWDGMQSHKSYRFSIGGAKWSDKSSGGKVFFVIGIIAVIAVVGILVFTAIKAFSM